LGSGSVEGLKGLGPDGLPRHQRGVTGFPGLYFLGMHNQYSRGSSLIYWVRHDAAYIASHIQGRAPRSPSGTSAGNDNPGEEPAGARVTAGQPVTAGDMPGRW